MNRLKSKASGTSLSRSRDPRIDRTRAAFRSALIDLLAAEEFGSLSIRQIVEASASSNASFFRHYRDKHELLEDVMDQFLLGITDFPRIFLSDDQNGRGYVELCERILQNESAARVLLTGGANALVHEIFVERAVEWSLRQPFALGSSLPKKIIISHMVGASIGLIRYWLKDEPSMGVEDVGELIHRLVYRPVIEYSAMRQS